MGAVAIIGIGCRFPGGVGDASSYWDLLRGGRCAISEVPAGRWSLEGFYDPRPDLPNRSYSKWGGFLEDIESFDPEFFGLPVREAEAMDPQQRLLLQVAYEAVQDARQPLAVLRQAGTGVFVGVSNPDYGYLARHRTGAGDIQAGTGAALSIAANRISHRFDLSGPSLAVDTACSSALVAVDVAVEKLASGACDMALAGGVNLLLDPRMFVTFARARMLSPSGRLRAFDAAADGFVRGEGAGLVVLKRAEEALRDGDRIYAVIRATSVNQDGATGTITAPNAQAQAANMRRAVERAGIDPASIAFAEAHGTGTQLGDPAEAGALGAILGGAARGSPLLLGTAKANIGHLEPAAGIAGLIKAALSLHRGSVPPLAGFERANPSIPFDDLGLAVPRETTAIGGQGAPAAAVVNSSGFGGTNACAVLEAAPAPSAARGRSAPPAAARADAVPVPLSAASETQLRAWAARLAAGLASGGMLAGRTVQEIASALGVQRDHFPHRVVVVAQGVEELREKLECFAAGRQWPQEDPSAPPQIVQGRARRHGSLAFAFTGQGGQWWAMGRSLVERNPVVRQSIETFDRVFRPVAGWSVLEVLLSGEEESRVHDPAITPAVMFALQSALVELWRSAGVSPDLVIGHSFGEVTAAYTAGCLAPEQIAPLVNHRGLIRGAVDRQGAMAAVGLGARQVEPLLPSDGSIEIGAYNSPGMVTLTGEAASIDALIAALKARDPNIRARRLDLDFAWHSSWLDPVEEKFRADVGDLAPARPRVPVISTVTGEPEDDFGTGYWWRNLRYPVRFQQAVERAIGEGADCFIEIGPDRTLSAPIAQCAAGLGQDVLTVTTLSRKLDAHGALASAVGQLFVTGIEIDWAGLLGTGGRRVALPCLPWQQRRCWSVPEEAAHVNHPRDWHPLLGGRQDGPAIEWRNRISLATHPWLGDHRIGGQAIFPLAGVIEMMRAAAAFRLDGGVIELCELELPEALAIDEDAELHLRTGWDGEHSRVSLHARRAGSEGWTLHARASAYPLKRQEKPGPEHFPGGEIAPGEFYAAARQRGYGYGTSFRCLERIVRLGPHVWGEASSSRAVEPGCLLDPGLFDSCLQLMIATDAADAPLAMPRRVRRVVVAGGLRERALAGVAVRRDDAAGAALADFRIAGEGGGAAVTIEGLEAADILPAPGREQTAEGEGAFYEEAFTPLDVEDLEPAAAVRRWIVLAAPGSRAAMELAQALRADGQEAEIVALSAAQPRDRNRIRAAISAAAAGGPEAGLIHALPLDDATEDLPGVAAAMRREVEALTAAAQALQPPDGPFWPRTVRVLTRRARIAEDETPSASGLAQSALTGLFRTLAMECPDLDMRLIDLDEDGGARPALAVRAVTGRSPETELVIRGNRILVPRLRPLGRDALPARTTPVRRLPAQSNASLRPRVHADLDTLIWQETRMPRPAAGEVVVEVRAGGLNFRDLMAANGLLPADAEAGDAAQSLGLEFAGVVRACGADAAGLAPGTRVFGMSRGALGRFIAVPAHRLHRTPDALGDLEAATLPAAWLTAHHALNGLARLSSGEKVLIHNGAGGVGLAAIALARAAGAEVLASAGSAEKRRYLRGLGITHVFDSRGLDFAGEVLAATGGAGVDVVLNALSGPAIAKGLACLAPYGRFVELGKRDVHGDGALALKALRRNVSLHVVDLAAMIEDRPEQVRRLVGELLEMFQTGTIALLPLAVFKAGEAAKAFRRFGESGHIGKIAVDLTDGEMPVTRDAAAGPGLDPKGSYLVTGGTRGFGLAVALAVAARGAGRVLLASRSGALSREAGDAVERVDAAGGRLEALSIDVTDAGRVRDLIGRVANDTMPLRGIVHAAVAYADAPLTAMTREGIATALAAKAEGALNLTAAALEARAQLDFLVTFSSAAEVTGWAGQSNYAAANAFLPALARYQRAIGIPGTCLAWGALGDSGEVARNADLAAYLRKAGWRCIGDGEAIAALDAVLASRAVCVAYLAADWPRLAAAHRCLAVPRLARITAGPSGRASAGARLTLAECAGEEQRRRAGQIVRAEMARVLRVEPSALAGFDSIDEAGLDSLSSLELRSRLETALGIAVPLGRFALEREICGLADLVCALSDEAEAKSAETAGRGACGEWAGEEGLAPAAE